MKKTLRLFGILLALVVILIIALILFGNKTGSTLNIFSTFNGRIPHIVVPGYTPAGFTPLPVTSATDTYRSGPHNESIITHYRYSFGYCNDKGQCFYIENACEGMGGLLGGDKEAQGTSKLYGNFVVQLLHPGTEGNGGDQDYVISSWMGDKQRMENDRKAGIDICADEMADSYHLRGTGLSLQEAVKVAESLVPIGR